MSKRVIRALLIVKGIAFGFLVASAIDGGTRERIAGFGLSAFFMGAAAVLLHISTLEPSKSRRPPPTTRATLRGIPLRTVVIRVKRDLDPRRVIANALAGAP